MPCCGYGCVNNCNSSLYQDIKQAQCCFNQCKVYQSSSATATVAATVAVAVAVATAVAVAVATATAVADAAGVVDTAASATSWSNPKSGGH
jgi:hypothetical protein